MERTDLPLGMSMALAQDSAAMERFAALFGQCDDARVRFELLPYHEYGREKWEKCGRPYTFRDGFVTEEERQRYEQILRSHGLSVVHT